MASERIQRRTDSLLDDADAAFGARDWARLRDLADDVLSLEPENADAVTFRDAAMRNLTPDQEIAATPTPEAVRLAPSLPASFVAGRYAVRRFLGEGGRKRVYLAHDTRLDREVAFCSIRTDGLDALGRERVARSSCRASCANSSPARHSRSRTGASVR